MSKKSESLILKEIIAALSMDGVPLWRNNTGKARTVDGRFIKFGIPSADGGGSDLIGITPVTITADMVGKTIGVFTAVEVKSASGRATAAQGRFICNVKKLGGFAGIARSDSEARNLINSSIRQLKN